MNDHHTYIRSRTREFIPNVLTSSIYICRKGAKDGAFTGKFIHEHRTHIRNRIISITQNFKRNNKNTHFANIVYSIENVSYYEHARTHLPKNK